MKNIGIIISIILIMLIFIYTLDDLSNKNICSGVRIFDCQKNKNIVDNQKYLELKPTGDIFLNYCIPKITTQEKTYLLDYSDCNLKVNILKDKPWVDSVEVNSLNLTREQINSNFK